VIVLQIIGYALATALIIGIISLVVSVLVWVSHQIEAFIQKAASDVLGVLFLMGPCFETQTVARCILLS
jgi:hypothetical protein